jgi:hypothetical protein
VPDFPELGGYKDPRLWHHPIIAGRKGLAMGDDITIVRPYNGRWNFVREGTHIGYVIGDAVIGFTARDENGFIVGYARFDELVEALAAVFQADEIRCFEADHMWAWIRLDAVPRGGLTLSA